MSERVMEVNNVVEFPSNDVGVERVESSLKYAKVCHEISEGLAKVSIPMAETRVLWAIIRKTYGFQKAWDRISSSQLAKLTEMTKQRASSSLNGLIEKKIIIRKGGSYGQMKINADSADWIIKKKATKANFNSIIKLSYVNSNSVKPINSNSVNTIDNFINNSIDKNIGLSPAKKSKSKAAKKTPEKIILPEWVNSEQWNDFKENRKSLRKPVTIRAEKLLINKLADLSGQSPLLAEQIINQTIENGWSGFFQLKQSGMGYANNQSGYNQHSGQKLSTVERNSQKGRALEAQLLEQLARENASADCGHEVVEPDGGGDGGRVC